MRDRGLTFGSIAEDKEDEEDDNSKTSDYKGKSNGIRLCCVCPTSGLHLSMNTHC